MDVDRAGEAERDLERSERTMEREARRVEAEIEASRRDLEELRRREGDAATDWHDDEG